MNLYEYLHQQREDLPAWLGRFKPGDSFPREEFFASRVVYYPGADTDGHPVKVFGSTHSACCFVYADYSVPQDRLEAELADPVRRFRGYHVLTQLQLRETDIVPRGWTPSVHLGELPEETFRFARVAAAPFGFLAILERDPGLDESHGTQRLAILFLGADGVATYDALFCQGHGNQSPFAVLLQDHGFGMNYTRFGRGGLLERVAKRQTVMPQWLLIGENTEPWNGFERVADVEGDRGGMHGSLRYLYHRP